MGDSTMVNSTLGDHGNAAALILSSNMYPHIVDAIMAAVDDESLVSFRLVCRATKQVVEQHAVHRLVFVNEPKLVIRSGWPRLAGYYNSAMRREAGELSGDIEEPPDFFNPGYYALYRTNRRRWVEDTYGDWPVNIAQLFSTWHAVGFWMSTPPRPPKSEFEPVPPFLRDLLKFTRSIVLRAPQNLKDVAALCDELRNVQRVLIGCQPEGEKPLNSYTWPAFLTPTSLELEVGSVKVGRNPDAAPLTATIKGVRDLIVHLQLLPTRNLPFVSAGAGAVPANLALSWDGIAFEERLRSVTLVCFPREDLDSAKLEWRGIIPSLVPIVHPMTKVTVVHPPREFVPPEWITVRRA